MSGTRENIFTAIDSSAEAGPSHLPPEEKATTMRTVQKRERAESDILSGSPSLKKEKKEEGNWSSSELSALYTFIKQFGTSESALEFISACGVNRECEEIASKVAEIREMVNKKKRRRIHGMKETFEEMGKGGAEDVFTSIPMDPANRLIKCQWTSATLSLTSQFRGFAHGWSKDAICDALQNIPDVVKEDEVVSESPLERQGGPEKLDINYGKIREFLSNSVCQVQPHCNLNSLESAIVLQMMDELWDEAQEATSWGEKAVLRGLFKNFQKKNLKENLQSYPDFPCDELSATQLYLDPLRSRDWNIPKGARVITREDVDAFRTIAVDDFQYDPETEEIEDNIPVVQIEPSEMNSSRYPPASFIQYQRLQQIPVQNAAQSTANFVRDQSEELVEDDMELLHRL